MDRFYLNCKNPEKSHITTEPGLGWNNRGISAIFLVLFRANVIINDANFDRLVMASHDFESGRGNRRDRFFL